MADKKDKKKSSSKPAGRLTVGRLSFMIRDLKKIKAEMMPDDEELLGSLDPTNLDDFQKQKALLNKHLGNITQSVSDMNDLKKQRGGARDPELIAMQNENYKMLKQAENMWLKLKDAFEKGAKKKMDPKLLEDRRKFVELFGKELMKLQELNSGIKRQPNQDATMQAINKNRERALERANRRAQRRQKREATRKAAGTGGTTEDVEMDEYDKPASAQEQAFFMEVQENDKKMDQLLDVISAGLKELKEIAVDVGTNLDTQKQLLEEVDKKMDETLENYETANARLKQLLDDNTGGIETWCPILILVVVLLAIVGYLFSII